MLDRALDYAERGWRVLPLAPSQKFPICPNGVHDATTSEVQIRRWFGGRVKDRNIGIACGKDSGIVVLDIDPRNGGDESLRKLVEEHGDLPRTLRATTGGGGEHYFFRYPSEGIKKGVVADGVDLVSDGGHVVGPPSIHPSGRSYTWQDGVRELAELPDWVLDEMGCGDEYGDFSLPTIDDRIPSGMRNNMFIRIAGAMRRWGLSDKAIEAALQIHNKEACEPPMTEKEVRQIANSAVRYEPEVTNGTDARGYDNERNAIFVEDPQIDGHSVGGGSD